MPGLHDLVVEAHTLSVEYRILFLSRRPVSEALITTMQGELDEHLAHALEMRGLSVLRIEQEKVEVGTESANGTRR